MLQLAPVSAMLGDASGAPPLALDRHLRVSAQAAALSPERFGDLEWSRADASVRVDVDFSSGDLTITSGRAEIRARHLALVAPAVAIEGAAVGLRDPAGALRSLVFSRRGAVEELLKRTSAPTGYELDLPVGWTMATAPGDATVVEIFDARRNPRFRIVADAAWDADGSRWPVETRINGRQVTYSVDARATGDVLIDPAWSGTETPAHVRSRASATVLANGKVFLAGGRADTSGSAEGSILCSTEIYDPLDESWSMGPSITDEKGACVPLMDHTATPLRDGTILLAGGANDASRIGVAMQPGAVASAWIFDPRSSALTPTGSMVEGRVHHTATLLASGQVVIVGGSDRQAPLLESILDCASNADGSETCEHCVGKASAEIYDPTTKTFTEFAMPIPRACHTATLLSANSLLLIGGGGARKSVLGKTWGEALTDMTLVKVDASGPTFTSLPMSLNTGRFGHVAVLHHDGANPSNDELLVAFGRDERAILPGISQQPNAQLAEIFRVSDALTGASATSEPLDAPVCCDPSNTTCVSPEPCVTRRSYTAATSIGRTGQALVVGGQEHDLVGSSGHDATPSDKIDVFDFQTRSFTETTLGHSPVLKPSLTTLPNGKTLLLGLTAPPVLFDHEAWAFAAPTTPMKQPRAFQTVTQLSDGTLLVAGGQTGLATKGAEIYDPRSSPPTTAQTAPMTACRFGHTATLLPASACEEGSECCSGTCSLHRCVGAEPAQACALGHGERVLLAGGGGLGGGPMDGGLTDCNVPNVPPSGQPLGVAQANADIYDVGTGTFRAARGSMHTPRAYHSATRLANGQVLLVGGLADGSRFTENDPGLASAELFDPATEEFTEIDGLATGRFLQSATPLPSGDILFAGGFAAFLFGEATTELAATEIFDRSTSSFRPAANLVVGRGYHTATALPDGDVLLTGGSVVSPSAEIFSAESETSRLTAGPMHRIRIDARALMVATGKVLIVGGDGANSLDAGPPFADAELFDVVTEQFEEVPCEGCTGRVDHAMVLLPNGSVALFGGSTTNGAAPITTAEVATIDSITKSTVDLPNLESVASVVVLPGEPQALAGTQFTSFWETSSGPYVSPTNNPVAVWVPVQGAPVVGTLSGWTDTSADWTPHSSAFAGPGLLFATRNGQLSSTGLPVSVEPGPLGVACTADTACASGFCSDGVCCNERCHDAEDPDALCRACSVALGAAMDGVCTASESGTDPHQDCAALPQCAADSARCGSNGKCRPCTCNAQSDCADGYVCTADGVCAAPATSTRPQGCSMAYEDEIPAWFAFGPLAALAAAATRRRHPRTSPDRQPLRASKGLRADLCAAGHTVGRNA